jgi:hypothetical protein
MLAVAYATGGTSHARQVKGDDPDIEIPWPSRLGVGGWAWGPQPHPVENIVSKPQANKAGRIHRQRHETIHKGLRLRTRNKLEWNTGTWNVCSKYTARVLKAITNQLSTYKVDILVVAPQGGGGGLTVESWKNETAPSSIVMTTKITHWLLVSSF